MRFSVLQFTLIVLLTVVSCAQEVKRWPSFVENRISSLSNSIRNMKLPFQFMMLNREQEGQRNDHQPSNKILRLQQQLDEHELQSESRMAGLEQTLSTIEASVASANLRMTQQSEQIRSLRTQLSHFFNEPAAPESDEAQSVNLLANYTVRERCAYKNSSVELAVVTGKTFTPQRCAENCEFMRFCDGFVYFRGNRQAHALLQGCYYVRDTAAYPDLLCFGDSKPDMHFTLYMKIRPLSNVTNQALN